jgi:hypothetical protein
VKHSKVIIAILVFVVFSVTDAAAPPSSRSMRLNTNDRTSCFPQKLWGFLGEVQRRFGKIEIVSGHRGRAANRRRGGAKGSLHVSCRAADFRVPGVDPDKVREYLASNFVGRGGVGFYCGDRFHLDVGNPRTWGGCKPFKMRGQWHQRRGKPRYHRSYRARAKKPKTYRRTGRTTFEEIIFGNSAQ